MALAIVGCGGSPTSDAGGEKAGGAQKSGKAEKLYKEIGGLTGQARRDKLVKLAQEEGEFNLYTSMTSEVADSVTEAFSDEFDVDVNLYRASSETVLQRVLQEQKANYAGNDAVESNATEMFALSQEKLLADYQGERRELVSDTGRFDGWTATRYNLFAPSWNTKMVKKGEEPTSWEELADPKWDGQLSMEVADYDWYLSLYGYWEKQGKSKAEIDKLFADMASKAKIVKGHTVQGELMSAGQFAITASNYSYLVEQQKRAGAPVDYQPFVEPVISRPNGIALMKTAVHPAAAMLFADWILEEGQKVLVDEGLTPSISPDGSDPLEGIEVIPVDVKALIESGDEWSKKYDEVVAGGEAVEN
ncbi:MAG: ABC transporter substrate-binding protein [Actinomycetes bacterium]